MRHPLTTLGACVFATMTALAWLISLYKASGIPTPPWNGPIITIADYLIAYPLPCVLIIWALNRYWRQADFREVFLLGWALGCTVLTLSGPFYPYPDRGTMTLQVPLYVIATTIFFRYRPRNTLALAALAVLLFPMSLIRSWHHEWTRAEFRAEDPDSFLHTNHREFIETLRHTATPDDILLVDKTKEGWATDDLWLLPDYPGKFYCSHYFHTVNYERKRQRVIDFYGASSPAEQRRFLGENKIRFVFFQAGQPYEGLAAQPDIEVLLKNDVGALLDAGKTP